MDENSHPGWIERQLFAEFRFLIFLLLGFVFLSACATYALLASTWGIVGVVLLVLGLALIGAAIGYELWLFWRRFASRREPTRAP